MMILGCFTVIMHISELNVASRGDKAWTLGNLNHGLQTMQVDKAATAKTACHVATRIGVLDRQTVLG
jgi:hypothetical protein